MSLYCQKCQTATAVVHVTELKGGKKVELHLCDDCAEAQHFPPKPASPTMLEIFQQFMEKSSPRRGQDRACPECGMTFAEFKSKGRFGCANDYDLFQGRLTSILERIHGSSHHLGGTPPPSSEEPDAPEEMPPVLELPPPPSAPVESGKAPSRRTSRRKKLDHLQRALRRAVESENYEEAAQLRDKIRSLEEKLEDEGGDA